MREAQRLKAENEQLVAANRALAVRAPSGAPGPALTASTVATEDTLRMQEELAQSVKVNADLVVRGRCACCVRVR